MTPNAIAHKFYFDLGRKNMIAYLFMLLREEGVEAGLKKLACDYDAIESNPHVKWYLANHDKAKP